MIQQIKSLKDFPEVKISFARLKIGQKYRLTLFDYWSHEADQRGYVSFNCSCKDTIPELMIIKGIKFKQDISLTTWQLAISQFLHFRPETYCSFRQNSDKVMDIYVEFIRESQKETKIEKFTIITIKDKEK